MKVGKSAQQLNKGNGRRGKWEMHLKSEVYKIDWLFLTAGLAGYMSQHVHASKWTFGFVRECHTRK